MTQGSRKDFGKEEAEKRPRGEIGNGTADVNDTRDVGIELGKRDEQGKRE